MPNTAVLVVTDSPRRGCREPVFNRFVAGQRERRLLSVRERGTDRQKGVPRKLDYGPCFSPVFCFSFPVAEERPASAV